MRARLAVACSGTGVVVRSISLARRDEHETIKNKYPETTNSTPSASRNQTPTNKIRMKQTEGRAQGSSLLPALWTPTTALRPTASSATPLCPSATQKQIPKATRAGRRHDARTSSPLWQMTGFPALEISSTTRRKPTALRRSSSCFACSSARSLASSFARLSGSSLQTVRI